MLKPATGMTDAPVGAHLPPAAHERNRSSGHGAWALSTLPQHPLVLLETREPSSVGASVVILRATNGRLDASVGGGRARGA